ncbi:MAG: IS66 family transposase zinc-finger binding domain-containing protein, partial [Acidobacteria bacterium]|nr:IS66 family transposase zinc-finger binding domain-containing protein [Acidobacteriota bacterium]
MISLEKEQRPDILRQVALLLDRENRHLHERIKNLTIEVAKLKGADAATLQLEIEQLREMLARREQAIFGVSSEKRPRTRQKPEAEREPQTGHGPTEQKHLPVLEETLELAPDERTCPACNGTLEEMGDQADETEEITVVRRQFYLVKRRRQKYRCRCNGA